MRPSQFPLYLAVLLFMPWQSHATEPQQISVRTGVVGGSYAGTRTGTFLVPSSFDIDYELFQSVHRSLFFRALLALELPDSLPRYSYFGTGIRYYFGSQGIQWQKTDGHISVSSIPTWRYYVEGNVGISIVIIQSFGSVLQIVSDMFDVGASVGVIRQITPQLGFGAQIGGSSAMGFTSSSLIGFTYRGLAGITYSF